MRVELVVEKSLGKEWYNIGVTGKGEVRNIDVEHRKYRLVTNGNT